MSMRAGRRRSGALPPNPHQRPKGPWNPPFGAGRHRRGALFQAPMAAVAAGGAHQGRQGGEGAGGLG